MAKKKKEFGTNTIYIISNYIYWLLLGTLYFTLMNLPFILIVLVSLSNNEGLPLTGFDIVFFLCCIPFGPAVTALLSIMGRLVREKSIDVTKDYFIAYKTNFFQALFLWTIEILVIKILFVDILLFKTHNFPGIITVLLYILIVFVFMMGFYMFPILSRFHMKSIDIIKISRNLTIKKPHITLINLVSFIAMGYTFFKLLSIFLLFFPGIICFSIMYYEQKLLLELEQRE